MTVEKQALRVSFKRQVQDQSANSLESQSKIILQKLAQFLKDQSGQWTLFSPLTDEPNLVGLLKESPHIQWFFPKVESKTEMNFYEVSNSNELVASAWGLNEPMPGSQPAVGKEEFTGCIIPGIAFDTFGNRLGRGGGFYDRFLLNFKGLKLGVAFEQTLTTERLPSESHDQKMNIVVSPEKWIDVDQSEVENGF